MIKLRINNMISDTGYFISSNNHRGSPRALFNSGFFPNLLLFALVLFYFQPAQADDACNDCLDLSLPADIFSSYLPPIQSSFKPANYLNHPYSVDGYAPLLPSDLHKRNKKSSKIHKYLPLGMQDWVVYEKAETELGKRKTINYGLTEFKAKKGIKVRGFRVADDVYFGHTKLAKDGGVGIVVDKGGYIYGLSSSGLAIYSEF